jgi:hypothetical protein
MRAGAVVFSVVLDMHWMWREGGYSAYQDECSLPCFGGRSACLVGGHTLRAAVV